VAEAINKLLEPMRARRAEYEKPGGDDLIVDVIREGTKRANVVAEETLFLAKRAMKLDFGRRSLS
jgi:tryptophanyl-tRNA synthetase